MKPVKVSDIITDISIVGFFLLMMCVSTCGFASEVGYAVPTWTQWMCGFAAILNCSLFGVYLYKTFDKPY